MAQELDRDPAEMGAVSDDLIAQHYSLGDLFTEAIAFWRRGAMWLSHDLPMKKRLRCCNPPSQS